MDGTGRAYTDNGLHIVEVEQFVGVNADGGHAHAVAHHAHPLAVVRAGETEHAAHIVELYGILKKFLCHEFGPERITGHNHGLGNLAFACPDMGSWCLVHNDIAVKVLKLIVSSFFKCVSHILLQI